MPYVRASIVHPRLGHDTEVKAILRKLVALYEQQPGYVHATSSNTVTAQGSTAALASGRSAGMLSVLP